MIHPSLTVQDTAAVPVTLNDQGSFQYTPGGSLTITLNSPTSVGLWTVTLLCPSIPSLNGQTFTRSQGTIAPIQVALPYQASTGVQGPNTLTIQSEVTDTTMSTVANSQLYGKTSVNPYVAAAAAPTVQTFRSSKMHINGPASNLTSATLLDLASKTLVILADDLTQSPGGIVWCCNGPVTTPTKGWSVAFTSGTWVIKVYGASGVTATCTAISNFRSCIALTLTGSTTATLNVSVDGGPIQAFGAGAITYTATDGTCSHQIGGSTNDGGSSFQNQSVCELQAISSVFTGEQLRAASNVTNTDNRLQLAQLDFSTLNNLGFWWQAARDYTDMTGTTSTSRGTSPVVFTINNTPGQIAVAEDVITPIFFDASLAWQEIVAVRRESFARTRFSLTNVQRIAVDAVVNGNASISPTNQGTGIFLDGTFQTYAASGVFDFVRHCYDFTVGGGNHTLELWDGVQVVQGSPVGFEVNGSYTHRVRITTSLPFPTSNAVSFPTYSQANPAPSNSRLVIYGDSLTLSVLNASPMVSSHAAIARTNYPGNVAVFAKGAESLFTGMEAGTSGADLAAHLVALAQQWSGVPGARGKEILLFIGTNDYGVSTQTAANFGVGYLALLDLIFGLDPTIHVWAMSMLIRSSEVANGFGNTCDDYRNQILSAVNARSSRSSVLTFVNGKTMLTLGDLQGDGLHPGVSGQAKVAAGIRAALGW